MILLPPAGRRRAGRDVDAEVTDLTCETTYYFELHAENSAAFFDYGTTPEYEESVEVADLGAGVEPVPFDATLTSLLCGRRYHFRARATNQTGTGYGDDETFSTSPCCDGEHVVEDLFVESEYPIDACDSILIFDSGVELGGALRLRSGRTIRLGRDFFVGLGGVLTVEIDPALESRGTSR